MVCQGQGEGLLSDLPPLRARCSWLLAQPRPAWHHLSLANPVHRCEDTGAAPCCSPEVLCLERCSRQPSSKTCTCGGSKCTVHNGRLNMPKTRKTMQLLRIYMPCADLTFTALKISLCNFCDISQLEISSNSPPLCRKLAWTHG